VWVYDARANVPTITKKSRPLTDAHFADFEGCYGIDPNGQAPRDAADSLDDRWRVFDIEDVKARDYKIDSFKWLRDDELDDAEDLGDPVELLAEAASELQLAVARLAELQKLLGGEVDA
jgi:type I restriction enzyme M protein